MLVWICFTIPRGGARYKDTYKLQVMDLQNQVCTPELKTLEWDTLNPDRLINLEINNKRRTNI